MKFAREHSRKESQNQNQEYPSAPVRFPVEMKTVQVRNAFDTLKLLPMEIYT